MQESGPKLSRLCTGKAPGGWYAVFRLTPQALAKKGRGYNSIIRPPVPSQPIGGYKTSRSGGNSIKMREQALGCPAILHKKFFWFLLYLLKSRSSRGIFRRRCPGGWPAWLQDTEPQSLCACPILIIVKRRRKLSTLVQKIFRFPSTSCNCRRLRYIIYGHRINVSRKEPI